MSIDKEKVKKCIRLFSSDKDGEVLAAVRAIERMLKDDGLSFHELADAFTGKIIEVVKVRVVEKVVEVDRSQKDWIEACNKLLCAPLKEYERKFVGDMLQRFELSPTYEPSEKQTNWFVILYRTHIGEYKAAS